MLHLHFPVLLFGKNSVNKTPGNGGEDGEGGFRYKRDDGEDSTLLQYPFLFFHRSFGRSQIAQVSLVPCQSPLLMGCDGYIAFYHVQDALAQTL